MKRSLIGECPSVTAYYNTKHTTQHIPPSPPSLLPTTTQSTPLNISHRHPPPSSLLQHKAHHSTYPTVTPLPPPYYNTKHTTQHIPPSPPSLLPITTQSTPLNISHRHPPPSSLLQHKAHRSHCLLQQLHLGWRCPSALLPSLLSTRQADLRKVSGLYISSHYISLFFY